MSNRHSRRRFIRQTAAFGLVSSLGGTGLAAGAGNDNVTFIDVLVTDDDGNPIEGATVDFEDSDYSWEGQTNSKGMAWYESTADEVTIEVVDGQKEAQEVVDTTVDDTIDVNITLTEPSPTMVDVWVMDDDGNPIEGATVDFEDSNYSWEGQTNSRGLSWYESTANEVKIRVVDGENEAREIVDTTGDDWIEVNVTPIEPVPTIVDVWVTDEDDNPIKNADVVFEDPIYTWEGQTNNQGLAWFETEEFEVDIDVSKSGFENESTLVFLEDESVVDVDVELQSS